MLPGQIDYGREMNLTHAAKLTRGNAAQVEALAKHRNKGKQKITIEHVHVYQGGQAAFIANGTAGEGVGKIGKGHPQIGGYSAGLRSRCRAIQGSCGGRIALRRLKEAGGATPAPSA
jgi:hypothetical protein